MKDGDAGYAIVRLELDLDYSEESRLTVKRTVWSVDEAAPDVDRLNSMHRW